MSSKFGWVLGLVAIILVIAVPSWYFTRLPGERHGQIADTPWEHMPRRPAHVDHSNLYEGPFETGQQVTAACLECHEEAANEVVHTTHWLWQADPVMMEGRDEPVAVGKKNAHQQLLHRYPGQLGQLYRLPCRIWVGKTNPSTSAMQKNVDCLVCHDGSGQYVKGKKGLPAEGVDLLAAAKSVSWPTRENCGGCPFSGRWR